MLHTHSNILSMEKDKHRSHYVVSFCFAISCFSSKFVFFNHNSNITILLYAWSHYLAYKQIIFDSQNQDSFYLLFYTRFHTSQVCFPDWNRTPVIVASSRLRAIDQILMEQ